MKSFLSSAKRSWQNIVMTKPFRSALVFLFGTWFVVSWLENFFEQNAEGHNIQSFGDSLWWGIVTFLTVGYGDRFPVSTEGRIMAIILMIAGVVCIAILTAKISSYFLEKALSERKGHVEREKLKNHFVICGWKQDMDAFLLQILASHQRITAENIVLVNNAPESETQGLFEIEELKKLKLVRGDFYHEQVLKRAAPEKAQKILILADATPNSAGQLPTPSEADARTVMTAMTLNNIAKGVLVAAEILDSAMDQYLRLAHVNEIIYSKDYARLLLAKASIATGVTNIFHELLDPKSHSRILTEEIPNEFLNKKFGDLKIQYAKNFPERVLLGVLENSGNSFVAKEKALRRAQQTPNVSELVNNLQSVKALRFNLPKFAVPDSYDLREGSMLIFIESKSQLGEVSHA